MAMIACRECGEQVSSEAINCPKCGIRFPYGKLKNPSGKPEATPADKMALNVFRVILILFLLGVIYLCISFLRMIFGF